MTEAINQNLTASFTLGNDAGRLGLSSDGSTILSDTPYTSSPDTSDTGKSLQLIGTSFVGALATPGAENQISSNGGGTGGPTGGLEANTNLPQNPTPDTKTTYVASAIKTKITAKTNAFAGLSIPFQGSATGYAGESLYVGKYFWNFGDGTSLETKSNEKFYHTYFYPGEYNVVLEYNQNTYGDIPDAIDKMIVKVFAPNIVISSVGDAKDFFVEVTNNTSIDADLSNWIISNGIKNFVFPKDTILPSNKKTTLSSKTTGFTMTDENNLKILFPTKEVVFDYGASKNAPSNSINKSTTVVTTIKETPKIPSVPTELPITSIKNVAQIPSNTLTASVVNQSEVPVSDTGPSFWIWIVGLVGLLGVASGITWFVRRGSATTSSDGNDFKILDE
jgi:hypothetical protein